MAEKLKVAIFEDDARYRANLETLLRHSPDFTCVETFGLIRPGLAAAAGARWDLVLMDLSLPDGSGVDAIVQLKATLPDVPVVALTVFEEPTHVLQAICAGADGYLLKRTPAAALLAGLRAVVAGGSPLTPDVARHVLSVVRDTTSAPATRPTRVDLTEREREVLRALADGAAYKEVADRLGISVDTVRTHIRALYRKLRVNNVAQAVGRALREGLV